MRVKTEKCNNNAMAEKLKRKRYFIEERYVSRR